MRYTYAEASVLKDLEQACSAFESLERNEHVFKSTDRDDFARYITRARMIIDARVRAREKEAKRKNKRITSVPNLVVDEATVNFDMEVKSSEPSQ